MTLAQIISLAATLDVSRELLGELASRYVVMGVRREFIGFSIKETPGAIFGKYPSAEEAREAMLEFRRKYPSAGVEVFTPSEDGSQWIKLATGERMPRG